MMANFAQYEYAKDIVVAMIEKSMIIKADADVDYTKAVCETYKRVFEAVHKPLDFTEEP